MSLPTPPQDPRTTPPQPDFPAQQQPQQGAGTAPQAHPGQAPLPQAYPGQAPLPYGQPAPGARPATSALPVIALCLAALAPVFGVLEVAVYFWGSVPVHSLLTALQWIAALGALVLGVLAVRPRVRGPRWAGWIAIGGSATTLLSLATGRLYELFYFLS